MSQCLVLQVPRSAMPVHHSCPSHRSESPSSAETSGSAGLISGRHQVTFPRQDSRPGGAFLMYLDLPTLHPISNITTGVCYVSDTQVRGREGPVCCRTSYTGHAACPAVPLQTAAPFPASCSRSPSVTPRPDTLCCCRQRRPLSDPCSMPPQLCQSPRPHRLTVPGS